MRERNNSDAAAGTTASIEAKGYSIRKENPDDKRMEEFIDEETI